MDVCYRVRFISTSLLLTRALICDGDSGKLSLSICGGFGRKRPCIRKVHPQAFVASLGRSLPLKAQPTDGQLAPTRLCEVNFWPCHARRTKPGTYALARGRPIVSWWAVNVGRRLPTPQITNPSSHRLVEIKLSSYLRPALRFAL